MYETSNKVSGQISARYTRTPEGKLLSVSIYTATGIKDYYYHYNAHGDVVAVTDSNGALYRQYAYDPYGNVISVKDGADDSINMSTDDFNHAYTYAGYRYDKETGLYFLNARYYNAGIGRFLMKDSVLGAVGEPETLNRYAYAEGNPISYIDPSGNGVILISALVGAAVGGIGGAIYSYKKTGSIDWRYVLGGATAGALVGVGLGYLAGSATLIGTAGGIVSTAGSNAVQTTNNIAHNAAQYDRLKTLYKLTEKYGTASVKTLSDGRMRFYGKLVEATNNGTMAGRQLVREWNPSSGAMRTWHETLDYSGRIRQIRPVTSSPLHDHFVFNEFGNFVGKWTR